VARSPARADDDGVHPDYLRSVMFGCEDGLVSTTGAIVGIAAGSRDADVVVLSGVVIVVVEALSMGAGQLLSERSVHQLDPTHSDSVVAGAGMMTVAYLLAGAVPLLPVVLAGAVGAVWVGVVLALVALFGLGVVKANVVGVGRVRSGLEILGLGGAACAVGVAVGLALRI
jgi:VIT1/CCC1 family predicted Fe2+/Mn2+ transporter